MNESPSEDADTLAVRRPAGVAETITANRAWWDAEAPAYLAEHGRFLGDADFMWCPEGLREADARLLGPAGSLTGRRVLEIGCGAAQCSRFLVGEGAHVIGTDLSKGMLDIGRRLNAATGLDAERLPLAQADGRRLPFRDDTFDVVFTAYGVIPFVGDSHRVMAEAYRVLTAGGRFVFATTHPFRWALPDDGGEDGLTVRFSYFDRTPYVEQTRDGETAYVEHHRTMGDRVREIAAAGFRLVDIVEPEWPEGHDEEWGAWTPLRGRLVPGTAIFIATKP